MGLWMIRLKDSLKSSTSCINRHRAISCLAEMAKNGILNVGLREIQRSIGRTQLDDHEKDISTLFCLIVAKECD